MLDVTPGTFPPDQVFLVGRHAGRGVRDSNLEPMGQK
jgi:hypothetical protein